MAGKTSDFHSLLEQAQRNQKISESLLSQRKGPAKQSTAAPQNLRNKDAAAQSRRTKQQTACTGTNKVLAAKTPKPVKPLPTPSRERKEVKPPPPTSAANAVTAVGHSFSDLMRLAKTNIEPKVTEQPPKLPEKSIRPAAVPQPVRTKNAVSRPVQPKPVQSSTRPQPTVPKKRPDAVAVPAKPKPVPSRPPCMNKPKPAVLPRRPAIPRRPSKLPTCEEEDEDDDMDDFIVDDDDCEDPKKISATIRSLFKYNRNRRVDYDDDDDCMESSYNDIIKEEKRSARIGMLEDLEDMMREEKERQKRKKKA